MTPKFNRTFSTKWHTGKLSRNFPNAFSRMSESCRYFEKHAECEHKGYVLQILPTLKGHESISVSHTLPLGAWTAYTSTLPFTVSSSFCFLSQSSKSWEHMEDNYGEGSKASEERYYIWSMQIKYFLKINCCMIKNTIFKYFKS